MRRLPAMPSSWKELKKELEIETKKLFEKCPDEIKRFHYGIITHSEAGKYSLNQYFGHWVHVYAFYFVYANNMPESIRRISSDPEIEIKHLKKIFVNIFSIVPFMAEYGGQKTIGKYTNKMFKVLDTINTKDEFVELLDVYQTYISRLYWWFHWYFPWGIGPSISRRLSPEDIDEIVRLSKEI
jgi:hypothetical protein